MGERKIEKWKQALRHRKPHYFYKIFLAKENIQVYLRKCVASRTKKKHPVSQRKKDKHILLEECGRKQLMNRDSFKRGR